MPPTGQTRARNASTPHVADAPAKEPRGRGPGTPQGSEGGESADLGREAMTTAGGTRATPRHTQSGSTAAAKGGNKVRRQPRAQCTRRSPPIAHETDEWRPNKAAHRATSRTADVSPHRGHVARTGSKLRRPTTPPHQRSSAVARAHRQNDCEIASQSSPKTSPCSAPAVKHISQPRCS